MYRVAAVYKCSVTKIKTVRNRVLQNYPLTGHRSLATVDRTGLNWQPH